MIIRKYTEGDRSGLIRLWTEAFPGDPAHNEPSKMIEAKLLVDDQIFVADENDRIMGACMAGYDGHRGWLYAVAVAKDQRRRGVGQNLIEGAMDSLKGLGCIKVNLQLDYPIMKSELSMSLWALQQRSELVWGFSLSSRIASTGGQIGPINRGPS